MARFDEDEEFTPSIIDRLIDLEPDVKSEERRSSRRLLIEIKESLRRDLTNLLNTRWACEKWPPDFSHVDTSVVNYGIPDFSGVNMASDENQAALLRSIENAIKIFEPRLITFSIEKEKSGLDRRLHFKIEGLLRAEPYREEVLFDASLKVQSSEFELSRK
jgi:type VI secretion system protein ImpF